MLFNTVRSAVIKFSDWAHSGGVCTTAHRWRRGMVTLSFSLSSRQDTVKCMHCKQNYGRVVTVI